MIINKTDINVFAGDPANIMQDRKSILSYRNNKDSNLFAGNCNLINDPIIQKRKEAMKEAMKIVGDAFKGDRKLDDDIERRHNNIDALKNEINNNQREINQLEANKKEMKEAYGIADDSQEQQDLELLEKRRDARRNPSIKLSEEEKQRLEIIDQDGMTEYQKYSLEMDALKEPFNKVIDDSQQKIRNETMTIGAIKLGRLKSHPMVDANVAADKILDTASGEIIGMLIDEAKNHVDEEMEEQKEAAEKIAEEKKEQEEKMESIKENKEQMEARTNKEADSIGNKASSVHNGATADYDTIEQLIDLSEINKDVQKEVQDIIDKLKLLPEDIVGAAVDASV
jgi:chromosome segregation ATPase